MNYCFGDLAECNKSELKEVKKVEKLEDLSVLDSKLVKTYSDSLEAATMVGMQKVAPNKRPGEPKKLIYMQLALFRFKAQKTDILISLNVEVD